MRISLLLSCLLLNLVSYGKFDTIAVSSTISSIKVLPEGTQVSLKSKISVDSGAYVLLLKDIPNTVNQEDIEFGYTPGLSILNVAVDLDQPTYSSDEYLAFKKLNDDIESVSFNIKALNENERNLLNEKKKKGKLPIGDEQTFAQYFKEQGTSIREQRRAAYEQLLLLKERSDTYGKKWGSVKPKFKKSKVNVYITFVALESLSDFLDWNYLIRTKTGKKKLNLWEAPKETIAELPKELPPYVSIKGKVIEDLHQAPIIFASVQFFQKGKLVSSTATNYDGEFELPLATNQTYDMVISFNGYKKKRYKKIFLNQAVVPMQTIRMEVKHKLTTMEFIAYTLPILDMLRYFVK